MHLLFAVDEVLLMELLHNVSRELAPKLGEEVARNEKSSLSHELAGLVFGRGRECGTTHILVENDLNIEIK